MDDGPESRLRRRERRIDEQLRELTEMGELSKLPGEGTPLVDDDPDGGERWAARHVAKQANLTPEFVELRREIADRRERLMRRLRAHRDWLTDRAALLHELPAERILDAARATTEFDARVESELLSAVGEMNALVARHNLKVPLSLQVAPLSFEHLRERERRSDDHLIRTARLDLVLFTMETLDTILARRASMIDGVALTADWLRRNEVWLRRRRDQIARDPEHSPWIIRAMVRRSARVFVGNVGFHGRPGSNAIGALDAVELGYSVEPEFRRQGFAEEATRGMMNWARARSISRFLVSIGLTNSPSLALAAKLGFREVTRVVDDEDGPEIVLELKT